MVLGFGKSNGVVVAVVSWWWHGVLSKITKKPNGLDSIQHWKSLIPIPIDHDTIQSLLCKVLVFQKKKLFLKPNDLAPRRYQHPCSCRRCLRSGNLPVGKVHSCYGWDSPVDGVKITSQQSKQSLSLGKQKHVFVCILYTVYSHMTCSLSQNAHRDLPHTLLSAPRLVRRQSKTAPPMGWWGEPEVHRGNAYRFFSYNLP